MCIVCGCVDTVIVWYGMNGMEWYVYLWKRELEKEGKRKKEGLSTVFTK